MPAYNADKTKTSKVSRKIITQLLLFSLHWRIFFSNGGNTRARFMVKHEHCRQDICEHLSLVQT